MRFIAMLLFVGVLAAGVHGQRPRAIEPSTAKTDPVRVVPPAAPQTVKAKYEGGVFGYNKKQDGTLAFDDANNRLVFRNKQNKEVLFIPYSAVSQAFADTQARRPAAASVVSQVPLPYFLNLPAAFIKKKYQYLTMQFYDEDSQVGGVTSFKLANKVLLASVVTTLANKAGLTQRGEIFVRQGSSGTAGVRRQWPSGSGRPMPSGGVEIAAPLPVDPAARPAVFVENEVLSNRVISLPRPVYPEEARASRSAGTVRVLVTVDEQGRVAEAEAVSGPSALQAAAVDAAKQAIFEPILKEGRPVKTKAVIAYNFQVS